MVGTGWVASIAALIYVAVRAKTATAPEHALPAHQPAGGSGGSASDIEIERARFSRCANRLKPRVRQHTDSPRADREDTRRNFLADRRRSADANG